MIQREDLKMSDGFNVGVLGGGFVGSAVAFGFGSSNGFDFDVIEI